MTYSIPTISSKSLAFIIFSLNTEKEEQKRKGERKKRIITSHLWKVASLSWKNHICTALLRETTGSKQSIEHSGSRHVPQQRFRSRNSHGTWVDDMVSGSQSSIKFLESELASGFLDQMEERTCQCLGPDFWRGLQLCVTSWPGQSEQPTLLRGWIGTAWIWHP